MLPEIHLNYLAIAVAVACNIVIGFLWYGPLFGKPWVRLAGLPENFKPEKSAMIKSMLLMVIGTAFTAYVLAHVTEVWRPSVWHAGTDSPAYVYGFASAFFSWLGFMVPLFLNNIAFEGKSWGLFGLNAGYQFIGLQTMGMILAYWR